MGFLLTEPIVLEMLLREVASAQRGGIATFTGLVRDHHGGRAVRGLEYSAYGPMAEQVCREILDEAVSRWRVTVTLRHRIGQLAIGEVAVAVAAAGDHREEAFAACRYVIEELKRRVPIWKREQYADGTEAWVDPTGQGALTGQPGAVPA